MIDMREDIGGAWDLSCCPGIRSDGDMYTVGFGVKRWTHAEAFGSGPAIKPYLGETLDSTNSDRTSGWGSRLTTVASFDCDRNV